MEGVLQACIASFPGLLHLQFLIVYSMQAIKMGDVVGLGMRLGMQVYARYLGLGMRYEVGICTIVISMNGAFK